MAYESAYVISTMTTAEDMQRHFIWILQGFNPPIGEAHVAIEHSEDELGYYVVSDGSPNPNEILTRFLAQRRVAALAQRFAPATYAKWVYT